MVNGGFVFKILLFIKITQSNMISWLKNGTFDKNIVIC